MKKGFFAFSVLALSSLNAEQSPQFQHTTFISKKSGEQSEYLAKFKIDKIVDEKSPPVEFTAPQVSCVEGQESVFSKDVEGNSYTVKVLVYKQGAKTKAKTSVIVSEDYKVVYTSNADFDIGD